MGINILYLIFAIFDTFVSGAAFAKGDYFEAVVFAIMAALIFGFYLEETK